MPNERTSNEISHAHAVREMFSGIAGRYDLLNHLLSANIDKRWRRRVSDKLRVVLDRPDAVVLDVACGTGDLSLELARNSKAAIIGSDFCRPMISIAKEKTVKSGSSIAYVEGDAMNLGFADSCADAVTIAFGLRNLSNVRDGLSELFRVLRPGGKLAILEFSSPVIPGFRQLFNFYFARVLPRIGGAISGSRRAYDYLPDSVKRFPDQKQLVSMLQDSGFCNVEYENFTGGIAALHTASRGDR
ncbi:MAG: bifunctional demethylmenaquinone methyltransferase/2-methoxy-6-polyprenyl-1,4-benzoquinol methylase UbiE [Pyrinomonadaceae bacterium]